MLIKRKFDIFTTGLIVIFIVVFCLTVLANMYLQRKNEELANISKELDFLTGLSVSLQNLEKALDEYMRNPGRHEAMEAEDAFEEFYRLIGKTRSFNMDEDELEIIKYLRSNMQRVSNWITNILSPTFEGSRSAFYHSIKLELFREVKNRIEEHWNEDMEKIEDAKLRAGMAEQRVILVYLITLLLLGVVIYLVRRTVNRQILQPLMNLNISSRRMAEGDLEHPIHINSSDELSQLAETFNRMASTIKQKIEGLEEAYQREQRVVRELAILNEFMGDVSNDTEMEDMLIRFAERASDLLKADGAAVVVRDLEGEEFFVSTHELVTQGFIDEILRMKGFKSSSLYLSEVVVAEKEPWQLSGKEIGSMIYIPVSSSTGMTGVLVVFNRKGGFLEHHEDTILSFAFQAFQSIAYQRQLAKLATTDGLTGLNNHRVFQERLEEEILRAERYKRRLFLLLIDIDHFKRFNDTYGHQTGDAVLQNLASVIRGSVRKVDFAARYGGEEFVIILPETDCENALMVSERIRNKVMMQEIVAGSEKITLTVSIGIACFPEDARTKEDLIGKADTALYYAKESGRNRVFLYTDIPVEKA